MPRHDRFAAQGGDWNPRLPGQRVTLWQTDHDPLLVHNLEGLLALSPVIPVIVIDDESQAVPLAQALVNGGLTVLEVTLRTPAGLSGIKRIAAEVPDAVVGAGTLLTPADVSAAVSAARVSL